MNTEAPRRRFGRSALLATAATGLALVGSGVLPDGHACDDFAALHTVDGEVRAAVASRAGARAFRVERDGESISEVALEMRHLS